MLTALESVKKTVGVKSAELIENGMIVGLGTGTTAYYFIEKLIERCRNGLKIKAVASSDQSMRQALEGGIPMIDINLISYIDLTVDGADEIDPEKRMIKGGGGALLREKIVASMSSEMIVIIDEHKLVQKLGTCKLPVEIIPFGFLATIKKLERLGFNGAIRKKKNGETYTTDNSNWIYDIHYPQPTDDPERDDALIQSIPGVVETGYFFNLAGRVIIGFMDGQIVIQP
jgi:ribose 5-phosphate isomerase A